jgi:spoIIIJ-associated protein
MADYIEKEGPSAEEAVFSALSALGITEDEAQVQVLAVGKTGRAKVRVARKGVELPPVDAHPESVSGMDHPVYVKPADNGMRRPMKEARYASEDELKSMEGILGELLPLMGIPGSVERVQRPGCTALNVRGEKEALLIGKKGATLQALQVFASERLNRDARGEKVQIQVDVSGYRARQEDKLMADAVAFADQAVAEDHQVATLPLTAADRRVVHLALKDRSDVETFSVGEGEFKRVVIQKKP